MNIKEYTSTIVAHGTTARGWIGGALRGGYVYKGVFWCCTGTRGFISESVDKVSGLEYI